ncbi:hypothetical protein ES288_D10G012300v1 [Gossypium darwinii]|uniref:Uncharacterized protein n=1 Tax=Gossypium darwinii TaxID=34276 RepID=A0A5D2ATZ0_GOSDA|nr:hypothetical protein ES288_D10G012300v1 [Gossypium darwinii]
MVAVVEAGFSLELISVLQEINKSKHQRKDVPTSSLSSLALWFLGSCRNSSVKRRHSWIFSGETKSKATFVHDWKT